MSYCDSDKEMAKNPRARAWIAQIASGDQAAFEFMWGIWNFEHCYDDLVDKDEEVTVAQAAQALCEFIEVMAYNPFFLKFKDQLMPLMISMINRWVEGDKLKEQGKAVESSVVRCAELDLFSFCAFVIGGWQHMRDCSEERAFDGN